MEGLAMESSISPIIANMYMEHFEEVALKTTEIQPSLWRRFVENIFVVKQLEHNENFLKHINILDQPIKFTAEDTHIYGSASCLDTLVMLELNTMLSISVYRKPTHTDQYLQ